MRTRTRSFLALVAATLMAACSTAHYPINPPLKDVNLERGYRAQRANRLTPGDTFFLHMAISGGGARAAAFGLGVLQALRDTVITQQGRSKRLIDEIDVLMGLSGGSMLAAWVGLNGVDSLPEFEAAFLTPPLQDTLVSLALSPRNLWRVRSPRFGRSDLLAEQLDAQLFKGATFADLSRTPRKPFVVIYATDMASGNRFEFVQEEFDLLCSDLDGVPLARAVAASSAVPIVLSPVTFWNHCARDKAPTSPRHQRPAFVHLLDGGLADNVGALGPIEYLSKAGGLIEGTRRSGYRGVRNMVFILANAETSVPSIEGQSADVPGPLRSALALADIPINRNSASALQQAHVVLQRWQQEVAALHAQGDEELFAKGARFSLIEVKLGDATDAESKQKLLDTPTTLQLPAAEFAALRAHAAAALKANPDFQRLLEDLRGR